MKPYEYVNNNVCMIKVGQPTVITLKDGSIVKGSFVTRRTTTQRNPQWVLMEKISQENEKVHYISEEDIEDVSIEPYGKPILIVKKSN